MNLESTSISSVTPLQLIWHASWLTVGVGVASSLSSRRNSSSSCSKSILLRLPSVPGCSSTQGHDDERTAAACSRHAALPPTCEISAVKGIRFAGGGAAFRSKLLKTTWTWRLAAPINSMTGWRATTPSLSAACQDQRQPAY